MFRSRCTSTICVGDSLLSAERTRNERGEAMVHRTSSTKRNMDKFYDSTLR